jgi:DNA-directed RNA polymerase subunit RPC12/RpoP
MPSTAVQETVLEGIAEAPPLKEQIFCDRCGNGRVHRAFREGFLQRYFYPLFGYYPWRCNRCGHTLMMQKRRRAKLRSSESERKSKRSN